MGRHSHGGRSETRYQLLIGGGPDYIAGQRA
jgi:hypothetical protein